MMSEFMHSTEHKRARRWNKRLVPRTVFLVMLCILALATRAEELTLITPPSNPSLKRALPLLSTYLTEKFGDITTIRPIISKSYNEAGQRFRFRRMSLVYGGSFLTYVLCAQGLAVPVARGENKDGVSTYRSVLLTKKGKPFHGVESIKGRHVTYVTEASSGDVFARWFFGGKAPVSVADTVYIPAKSHKIAVQLVQAGRADFAFVKDLAWKASKAASSDLHVVFRHAGEHPNNVLLISPGTYRTHGKRLESIMLGMDSDPDWRARQILDALGLKRFIPMTYPDDYVHTATLVRDAGLNPSTYSFSE